MNLSSLAQLSGYVILKIQKILNSRSIPSTIVEPASMILVSVATITLATVPPISPCISKTGENEDSCWASVASDELICQAEKQWTILFNYVHLWGHPFIIYTWRESLLRFHKKLLVIAWLIVTDPLCLVRAPFGFAYVDPTSLNHFPQSHLCPSFVVNILSALPLTY